MVDGLADVVQQTGALGFLDVHAELGGHHAAQGGNFQRMLEHVLREAGTVAELAQKADEFGMDAVHARVERGLFAHFADLHFKLLLAFVDNILNAGPDGCARPE